MREGCETVWPLCTKVWTQSWMDRWTKGCYCTPKQRKCVEARERVHKERGLSTGIPAPKWRESCVNRGILHGYTSTTTYGFWFSYYLIKIKRIKDRGIGTRDWGLRGKMVLAF